MRQAHNATEFLQLAEAALGYPVEIISGECGPVLGTHAGPGTVGVAFYTD